MSITKEDSSFEHLEIQGMADEHDYDDNDDDDAGKKPTTGGGGVSQWIMQKLKPEPCGDLDNVSCGGGGGGGNTANINDSDDFQPLKLNNSYESNNSSTPSGTTIPGGAGADMEEESSQRQRHHLVSKVADSSGGDLTGIEVEIGSSCSQDDCLNRKRFINTVWVLRKREIILGLGFIGMFLFGVLIGACGSGQCGAGGDSSMETSALKAQHSGDECNGESGKKENNEGVAIYPTKPTVDTSGSPYANSTTSSTSITNTEAPTFLGPNVFVFDSSWTTAQIQTKADAIFYQQQNNEMGTERYALLFQPGTYGSADEPLMLQIGYYTEISGLGENPTDVRILGKIEVYNRCFEADPYRDGKFIPTSNSEEGLCFALNSFWRGLYNLSITIVSRNQDPCRATAMFWAISQAASMRRVNIEGGDMSLMDYCSNPAYASGGFVADTKAGKIISGGQQQFITRNSNIVEWDGSTWNQFLMGVIGAPDDSAYPDPAITSLAITPASREKPFLYMDEAAGEYYVHVPSFATATSDVSWASGTTTGRSIPISDFYVADPSDTVSVINEELKSGKNLLITPGQYDVAESILVERADTVVLGIGVATLTAVNGAIPMKVSSQPGIIVAGVTFDAGLALSPVLLQVGALGDSMGTNGDPTNPITLSDVYFRVGGPHIGKANVCLEINSNYVLVDHTWIWRADHGVEDFDKSDGFDGDNERWKTNIGLNGIVVNGNDVIATGLFVEHFQEYNCVWNGERGRVYFFQNELPYEPPSQAEWMADDGTVGWAAYKVDESVVDHELWCGGVYCYNRNDPTVVTTNAFEVPSGEGISLNRLLTRNLSGPGTILNIVNGVGETVNDTEKGPFYTVQYPQ